MFKSKFWYQTILMAWFNFISAYIATKSLVKISIAYHILNPMYAHTKFDTSQIMPLYLKAIGSSAF